jgi:hypothetical protein
MYQWGKTARFTARRENSSRFNAAGQYDVFIPSGAMKIKRQYRMFKNEFSEPAPSARKTRLYSQSGRSDARTPF